MSKLKGIAEHLKSQLTNANLAKTSDLAAHVESFTGDMASRSTDFSDFLVQDQQLSQTYQNDISLLVESFDTFGRDVVDGLRNNDQAGIDSIYEALTAMQSENADVLSSFASYLDSVTERQQELEDDFGSLADINVSRDVIAS